MENTLADPELIKRVGSGDDDSYAELVRRHHGGVMALCASMLGGPSQADDAAQEVFLKAYRSLSKFRRDASFSTWLYRIASNHCLDLLRRRSREKSQSLDAFFEGDGSAAERYLGVAPDAAQSAETADIVDRAMRRLPAEYRLILTLREIQGLDYNELSQSLDCSLDAVKARLKRARKSLAEALRHFLEPHNV